MTSDIHKTLARLDLVNGREANCHFNNPADPAKIASFEERKGIRLPYSYKLFLEYTNGGMIVNDQLEKIIRGGDPETARWNAHYFLSLEEMEEKYDDMESWNFGRAELRSNTYPFIPFFSTPSNEYLVFVSLGDDKKESPVFDAFHEEVAYNWGLVADDFTTFLNNYLDTLGQPEVLGDVAQGMALDFAEAEEERTESPQETIDRTTGLLKTHPEDDWALMERGMAYAQLKQVKAAMNDFNASIALAGDDSFYYFQRSMLLEKLGKKRAALIDIDTAVKLKPDELLYLTLRASILQQMKKYSEALRDANNVIEKDNTDLLAYYTRESIYRTLGETEKADQDVRRIKELEEDE